MNKIFECRCANCGLLIKVSAQREPLAGSIECAECQKEVKTYTINYCKKELERAEKNIQELREQLRIYKPLRDMDSLNKASDIRQEIVRWTKFKNTYKTRLEEAMNK